MSKARINSFEELEFAIFCIENIAIRTKKPAKDVYKALLDSGILYDYIVDCYDVLHTQGKDYIVDDILECMKTKGVQL